MRFLVLALGILAVQLQNPAPSRGESSRPVQKQTYSAQQPASGDQRGTENSPAFVKVVPTPKTPEETTQETEDRREKTANDRRLVLFTGLLALIGTLQLFVFGYQAIKLKQTVEAAGEQSKDMKQTIAEAARSATAMEAVAKYIETSAAAATASVSSLKKQMRAYLSVEVGSGDIQNRGLNIKFAGCPFLVNTGLTPAHKVGVKARAEVHPVPLPKDFEFRLPDEFSGATVIGPRQQNTLSIISEEFIPDADIEDVKNAKGRALYVWGIVAYEDVFGEKHQTRFSQWMTWRPNNSVYILFTDPHNDAD